MSKTSAVLPNIAISLLTGIFFAALCQRFNNMFFYNVFIGTFISGICSILIFRLSKNNLRLEKTFRPFVVIISILLTFIFLTTIPLTIDRSYSVWLLKHVAESNAFGKKIDEVSLINDSVQFFSPSNGQLIRRIDEQKRIGNFRIGDGGRIEITKKGKLIAIFDNLIRIIFGLEPKYSKLSNP
jgi:hypothetical protein